MKKILYFFLPFLVFFSIANAQDSYTERIREFKTLINVRKDGVMEVVESIRYDFGNQKRHGIYRSIPYIKTNKEGKKLKVAIRVDLVVDEKGQKYKWKESKTNEQIQIKIGDPDKYISGIKNYIISYEVKGGLTYFSDHDELYWNATGNEWTVPIDKTYSEITLPDVLDDYKVKMACYTGVTGSTSSDCEVYHSGKISTFETKRVLYSNEGLTLALGFPKNIVAVLEPVPYVTFWERWYGKLLLRILFVAAGLLALFWYVIYPIWIVIKWIKYGRDPKVPYGPVTAWYTAPKTKNSRELTPAEVGTLIDETVHQREISAMIVDLARRGYLLIEEKKKKDFYFHKKSPKKDDSLMPFEKEFLFDVFPGEELGARVKDLKLAETVLNIKKQLYDGLVKEGFFPKNPQNIRNFYYAMGVLALSTLNVHTALIAFIFGRLMPRKTNFGAMASHVAKSLKNFLTSQERQLEFQAKNKFLFEKLLPFAVAFGVEKIWAQRFKDIAIEPPQWYKSYDGSSFSSINFARSLESSFGSFSRAATPTTSSSGFSSGFSGGSSGGGGGGGGGGSW